MNQTVYLPMADYVPHSGRMVLLDRVLSATHDEIRTEVVLNAESPFCENGAVGAWVGVEYMAQTIAALAGWEARERGDAVQVGFLVGTRRYTCHVASFATGRTLIIHAKREFQADNGVAVMDCSIQNAAGQILAEAQLSVYQPDNLQDYLQQAL